MLGHLMQWFYDGLAGIRQRDTSIAYKHIEIKPEPVIGVDKGKASFESPYGTIYSEWDHQYSWRVFSITIPANTTATIYLPSPEGTTILESNMPLKSHRDIQWLGYQQGKAVFKAGSGKYKFIIR
jgi:alpha-L-rhamnosidase